MNKKNDELPADNKGDASGFEQLVMFFRKLFCCSFDTHWNMKYDSGISNDICAAGTCLDCGYRTEGIEWPLMPKVRPSKREKQKPPNDKWCVGCNPENCPGGCDT